MIFLTLSELEDLLSALVEYAQRYRDGSRTLATLEERWAKFQELAAAFGVVLKPAEGVEFYAGGPLADNSELLKRLDQALTTVRKLKEVYSDVKVIVDLDLEIKKISIKI